ncbi:MAG: hypothetical protein Q7R44_00610, partial [bacterium]|nr:hypothetical protein [bacterium]
MQNVIYEPKANGIYHDNIQSKIAATAEKKFEEHSQIDKRRLDAIVRESREIYRIYSVFPFDLFPDILAIDENKITFIIKDFWKVERVHSIYVRDISDCIVQTSIIFSSLNVIDLGFRENWVSVSFL